jgi:hypothetical protein
MAMYARDEVAIRQTVFNAACEAHAEALALEAEIDKELATEYISFGPVCNADGTPTEFTKQMFGIK